MGTVIAIILLSVVAIPIIDSMDKIATHRSNDIGDSQQYKEVSSVSMTATWNSTAFVLSDPVLNAMDTHAFIVTDTILIDVIPDKTTIYVCYPYEGNGTFRGLASGDSLTLSGTTWTVVDGATTHTGTFSKALVPVMSGGTYYVPDELPATVDGESEIWGWNFDFTIAPYFSATGDVDSMSINVTYKPTSINTYTPLTGVSAVAAENGDVYSISGLSLSQTEGADIGLTNDYLAIPVYYTVMEEGGMVSTLVSLIPVLLVVGLIVALVYATVLRRD